MKTNIEFSIFSSPNEAYCNLAGIMDLEHIPNAGDEIYLTSASIPEGLFDGKLLVNRTMLTNDERIGPLIGFDGIVVNGIDEANKLATYFEKEFNFFCYRY